MSNSRRGARGERNLVNLLYQAGYAVIRAPASGGATNRELPDVLAGNGDSFYAIEVKTSSGDPIYLTNEEIEALEYFARQFGATALVAVRFNAEHGDPHYGNDSDSGWRVFRVGELHSTPKSYRVKKSTAYGEGVSLRDLAQDWDG